MAGKYVGLQPTKRFMMGPYNAFIYLNRISRELNAASPEGTDPIEVKIHEDHVWFEAGEWGGRNKFLPKYGIDVNKMLRELVHHYDILWTWAQTGKFPTRMLNK